MALLGLAPEVMRPSARVLNILVATVGTFRFARAGYFSWSLLWPFALGSIPLAFVGGGLHLPGSLYKQIVGLILLYAAVRLVLPWKVAVPDGEATRAPLLAAVAARGGIGLLSGLTGTGGGIFLSPFLQSLGWAAPRPPAGVSAALILANS